MAQQMVNEMKEHLEFAHTVDGKEETKEHEASGAILVYDTNETELIDLNDAAYNNGIIVNDEDLVQEPFNKNERENTHFLFCFGIDQRIFYAMKPFEKDQNPPEFYECYSLNTERPSQWPDTIHLMGNDLQKVQFIKRGSDTAQKVLDNWYLYGLKEGFLFNFGNETDLIYIIDKIIKPPNTDYVYHCTKINADNTDEFPEEIYLTKHQLMFTQQVLGLNWLKYRAIYNDQLHEMKKLEKLSIDHKDIDSEDAQLKLLRDEFLHYYFVINYHTSDYTGQIVYYVSEVKDVDTYVCRLSHKNALDTLQSELPFPWMIVLNNDDIHKADAFVGTGRKLKFDQDLYSLYASFYMSKKKEPTKAIRYVTYFTLAVQFLSILAIIWCFDVAYTEDVVKYYTIDQMQQCGLINLNDYYDMDNNSTYTPFCLHMYPNYTSVNNSYTNIFALIDDDGATQEFVTFQHWWYLIGYIGTAFASLLILTFYVYKNAVAPIKIRIALLYCDAVEEKIVKKVERLVNFNMFMVLLAYAVGVWSILTYPLGKGISNPYDVLALPISVVFVLEIDDWMFHIVQIGYTRYIQKSFGVEITEKALGDFGKKSWNLVRKFLYFQVFTCLGSLFAALESAELITDVVWSEDVGYIFFQISDIVFVFVLMVLAVFIYSSRNTEKWKKYLYYLVLIIMCLWMVLD